MNTMNARSNLLSTSKSVSVTFATALLALATGPLLVSIGLSAGVAFAEPLDVSKLDPMELRALFHSPPFNAPSSPGAYDEDYSQRGGDDSQQEATRHSAVVPDRTPEATPVVIVPSEISESLRSQETAFSDGLDDYSEDYNEPQPIRGLPAQRPDSTSVAAF